MTRAIVRADQDNRDGPQSCYNLCTMKNNSTHQICWTIVFVLASSLARAEAPKPNIVFVLADDLGWNEPGCYGNTFNETPHIDRMANAGVRFTQAYAAAPVCSPYRAALLTGQHPARLGILDYLRPNSANRLPTRLLTLPEMLKRNGYATGMIGKWHLSGYKFHQAEFESRPTDHGFDWNIASEVKGVGNGANTWPYVFRDQPIRWLDIPENRLGKEENLTDRLNLEAVEFIERNKTRPFFLYLSHYAPHTILNGRPDLVDKYRQKHAPGKSGRSRCHICEDAGRGKGDPGNHWAVDHNPHLAAMLEGIDDGVGKIRNKLAELKLLENTIFIFSSDNGGEANITSNAPLRGGKSQLYEGGLRVPMIVQWPTKIPAGNVSHQPTTNIDFYPTLLEAAGIELDKNQITDGASRLANWQHPNQADDANTFYWHYPLDQPHFLGGFSGGAIRSGDWKLIERFDSGKTELYNLANDPSEQKDLAATNPIQARELHTKLKRWQQNVSARKPSAPLLTKPGQLYFAEHFSEPSSDRLWYNGDWAAEGGVLQRTDTGTDNTRIFLRDAKYRDVLIRFDFQLQKSKDIRLVTGSNGPYNAVVHIRPDHFYVQTAQDKSGPYFSYRHGECAYAFDSNKWYTMTVEFFGDELVAHIDREHVAYATHPILDKERTYLAFQVDDQPAIFDNIQVLTASKHGKLAANVDYVRSIADNHPVKKSLDEEYEIRKRNAHEWLYQRKPEYRAIVKAVDDLDEQKKQRFPTAFRSHKEIRKQALALRKKLNKENADYKQRLNTTHRAKRAIDAFLIEQEPLVATFPNSRRKAALERLRRQHRDSDSYRKLLTAWQSAQSELEAAYPKAFVTDAQINAARKKAHQELRNDLEYKQLQSARAQAYRQQQDYLLANDARLSELDKLTKKK